MAKEYGVFKCYEATGADPRKAVKLYKNKIAAKKCAMRLEGESHFKHGEEGYTGYTVCEVMIKSSFETVTQAFNAISDPAILSNSKRFAAECSRICAEHGWELEEYDAEEIRRFDAIEQAETDRKVAETEIALKLQAAKDALYDTVTAWIKKHDVNCSENIHQSDNVIANAYTLIEDICNIVGYAKVEEDE